MRMFRRHRKGIEPLHVEALVEQSGATKQDNTAGPDDETFEEIEHDEGRSSRRGGFPNFGR
jgi:hypothetical protein